MTIFASWHSTGGIALFSVVDADNHPFVLHSILLRVLGTVNDRRRHVC
jgi:hypothetical protein